MRVKTLGRKIHLQFSKNSDPSTKSLKLSIATPDDFHVHSCVKKGTNTHVGPVFDVTDEALISGLIDHRDKQKKRRNTTPSFTFTSAQNTNRLTTETSPRNSMFMQRKDAISLISYEMSKQGSALVTLAAALLLCRAPSCAVSFKSYFCMA